MGDISEHFNRCEFACRCGCGFDTIHMDLVNVIERARQHFNKPITINCGCRCEKHNKAVGGVSHSQHLVGCAADIAVDGVLPEETLHYFTSCYPDELGLGLYATFVHVDIRKNKSRWQG